MTEDTGTSAMMGKDRTKTSDNEHQVIITNNNKAKVIQNLPPNDEILHVYHANTHKLRSQAKIKLYLAIVFPVILPCAIPNVSQLLRTAPYVRYYISQYGLGTFISDEYYSNANKKRRGEPSTILDYNLISNTVGFHRWNEILCVRVIVPHKKLGTILSIVLKEVVSRGENSTNRTLDWAVEEAFQVKILIEEQMTKHGHL